MCANILEKKSGKDFDFYSISQVVNTTVQFSCCCEPSRRVFLHEKQSNFGNSELKTMSLNELINDLFRTRYIALKNRKVIFTKFLWKSYSSSFERSTIRSWETSIRRFVQWTSIQTSKFSLRTNVRRICFDFLFNYLFIFTIYLDIPLQFEFIFRFICTNCTNQWIKTNKTYSAIIRRNEYETCIYFNSQI